MFRYCASKRNIESEKPGFAQRIIQRIDTYNIRRIARKFGRPAGVVLAGPEVGSAYVDAGVGHADVRQPGFGEGIPQGNAAETEERTVFDPVVGHLRVDSGAFHQLTWMRGVGATLFFFGGVLPITWFTVSRARYLKSSTNTIEGMDAGIANSTESGVLEKVD